MRTAQVMSIILSISLEFGALEMLRTLRLLKVKELRHHP